MGKSILDFTSINGRSGTEFTQVKGRSGTVFWCKPYILTLSSKPTGVDTITCYRYSSLQPGAATGPSAVLTNGSTIYHGDVIYISATASSGYKAPSISSSTGTISSNMLPVDGNESITVTAGELDVAPVYITAGSGVSSVFLSASSVGTGPEPAGSNFNIGSTVYGFAVLQTGYNPGSGWTLVSGSTYRVGSLTVGVSGNDFGTKSGSLKSFTITFSVAGGLGGSWGSATKTAYYGDTITRSGNTVTCSGTASWTNTFTMPSAPGYTYSRSYSSISSPVSGAQTITVTVSRTANIYTVSFANVTGGSWNSVSGISAPYGSTISVSGNTVTVNGSSRTFSVSSTSISTGYVYLLTSLGVSSGATVTGNMTITPSVSTRNKTYGWCIQIKKPTAGTNSGSSMKVSVVPGYSTPSGYNGTHYRRTHLFKNGTWSTTTTSHTLGDTYQPVISTSWSDAQMGIRVLTHYDKQVLLQHGFYIGDTFDIAYYIYSDDESVYY